VETLSTLPIEGVSRYCSRTSGENQMIQDLISQLVQLAFAASPFALVALFGGSGGDNE
jgi:hypothetical protein